MGCPSHPTGGTCSSWKGGVGRWDTASNRRGRSVPGPLPVQALASGLESPGNLILAHDGRV